MTRHTAPRNRIRHALEQLDDRLVPATLVDLGTVGATGEANGALLFQGDNSTAATYSFLKMQGTGVEQGYNTDARPLEFDADKKATTSLTLGQVPLVTVDGVNYREFLLEISQAASKTAAILSLDELRIFTGSVGNLSGYSGGTLAGQSAVYDLDGAGDVTVRMDDRISTGTGSWDVRILVPDTAFTGLGVNDFVYLYSSFGGTFAANNGAEVWAVRPGTPTPGPTPPPPTGGSLSGFVYVTMDGDEFRETEDTPPETGGVSGVEITLFLNGQFYATTTTDTSGHYEFTNLADGTYTISRGADPNGFFDSLNEVGSLGGTSVERGFDDPNAPDLLDGIEITGGADGIEYNFGMFEAGDPG